jgi:carboxylesterase type B
MTGGMDNEAGLISGMVLIATDTLKKIPNLPSAATSVISAVDWLKDGADIIVDSVRKVLHLMEDGVFNCPAAGAAAARVAAGVPTWRYRMMAAYENSNLHGVGAFHSSDVPIVLGTTERRKGPKNTAEEDKMVKNTMTAWAAFAKDPAHGLDKLGWPKYDPKGKFTVLSLNHRNSAADSTTGKTLIRLGYQNKAEPNIASSTEHDGNCKYLKWAP